MILAIPFFTPSHCCSLSVILTSRSLSIYSCLSWYCTYYFEPFIRSSWTVRSLFSVTQFSVIDESNNSSLHSSMNWMRLNIVESTSSISSDPMHSPTICFHMIPGRSPSHDGRFIPNNGNFSPNNMFSPNDNKIMVNSPLKMIMNSNKIIINFPLK